MNLNLLLNIDINKFPLLPQDAVNAFNTLRVKIVLNNNMTEYLSWHRLNKDWTVKFINPYTCLLELKENKYTSIHYKLSGDKIKEVW
jgi:hypothetical protein